MRLPFASSHHQGPGTILALLAVYLIWGTTYLATRFAVESMPPVLMIAVRYLLAGWILYGAARLTGTPRPTPADWKQASILGVCVMGICNGIVALVADQVPTGSIACIFATGPFVLTLVSWVSGNGPCPNPKDGISMMAGFTGVLLLTGAHHTTGNASWTCSALLLVATLSWAIGTVWTRKTSESGSIAMSTSLQMLCGGTFCLAVGTLRGEWSGFNVSEVTGTHLVALAYLGLFGSIVAFLSYNHLLRSASVSVVASHAYVNPLVAMLAGVVVLGERFTRVEAFSAALILGAVIISLGGGGKSRPPSSRLPSPRRSIFGPWTPGRRRRASFHSTGWPGPRLARSAPSTRSSDPFRRLPD